MVFNIRFNTPKMKLALFIHLLCCSFVLYSYCEYIGLDGGNCSYGFAWNSTEKMCLPCEDGFLGPKCRDPCPFPYFGRGCLMKCNCTINQCQHHYKHGCNESKEIRNQNDQDEQKQTTYMLKIPIVLLTIMAFILLVFHIFTYSKCYEKCIFFKSNLPCFDEFLIKIAQLHCDF